VQASLGSVPRNAFAVGGNRVHVVGDYELRPEQLISPHDGVCWIYLARLD